MMTVLRSPARPRGPPPRCRVGVGERRTVLLSSLLSTFPTFGTTAHAGTSRNLSPELWNLPPFRSSKRREYEYRCAEYEYRCAECEYRCAEYEYRCAEYEYEVGTACRADQHN